MWNQTIQIQFFNQVGGLKCPCQILGDVYASESDWVHQLHTTDAKQWLCGSPGSSGIYINLLGSGGVEDQVVVCTPPCQMFCWLEVCWLVLWVEKTTYGSVVGTKLTKTTKQTKQGDNQIYKHNDCWPKVMCGSMLGVNKLITATQRAAPTAGDGALLIMNGVNWCREFLSWGL